MKRVALLLLVLLAGCVDSDRRLTARDGTRIAYDYHEGGWKGVILVHQLDGSRGDWALLEEKLQDAGYSYVALDLRGHGESDGDWTRFGNDDFESMVFDVEAAHKFLRVQGVEVFAVVGASVGASVAFKYAMWKDVPNLVLLSPGFNYKGMEISDEIADYPGGVMVVAGMDDEYAVTTGKVFERDLNATLVQVNGQAHGTEVLPYVRDRVVAFLDAHK